MKEDHRDYSGETREIYHHQHMKIANDKAAMKRFVGMFSTDYLGLDTTYFEGKRVLDAGCGDTAKLMIALARFGAEKIYGLDLGTDFIPVAEDSLKRHNVSPGKITLVSGNVLKLPFEDNFFDFVGCHGVLVHLNTLEEVDTAFGELARVTRPGGYLYTVFGIVGGLFEDSIFPAVRQYYKKNKAFKHFIDQISPTDFQRVCDVVQEGMATHADAPQDLSRLAPLFDTDLCVTIQNIIQAPVRLRIDPGFILEHYAGNGFGNVRRLSRFVKRENIRKYAAPLHYNINDPFSKLIYGSGNLEYIARKVS